MFEQPTVIITGAGSSIEFGLPSGKEIYQALKIESRNLNWRYQPKPRGSHSLHANKSSFVPDESLTFFNLMSALERSGETQLERQLLEITKKIDIQFDDSIDEYLFNNLSFSRIGKLLSVWRLYCSLYQTNSYKNSKPVLLQRDVHMHSMSSSKEGSRSWLASLAKKITQGCLNIDDLAKNKLSLITYNYDNYIEEGLFSLIKNSERFSDLESLDFIEVLHVNGKLKLSLTFDLFLDRHSGNHVVSDDIFHEIDSNSKNIYMVNEPICNKIERQRDIARDSLKNAEKIFVMGFAFDPNNVSVIGLDKLNRLQGLYALNYDGDIQLTNRIKSVGVNKNTIIGSNTNKVGCRQAALKGFFDQ